MSQKLRRLHDAHAADLLTSLPKEIDGLEHVVHMALRIDAAGNGETQQIKAGWAFFPGMRIGAEHHSANLGAADARFEIEFNGQ